MDTPAQALYKLIKANETGFSIPAPYFTINVGTFHPAQSTFTGLTTTVEKNPEPLEHMVHQVPHNPPPAFRGSTWVSLTIDSHWIETTTTVPAPIIPLAPVLLQFSIANPTSAWSVTADGVTVNAPQTQTTLTVSLWDAGIVNWTVQAGNATYKDSMRIQRPQGVAGYGVGAFTIPVLPVSIIYAPPVDSLNLSTSSYVAGSTVGTTVTTSFGNDSTKTQPEYTAVQDFKNVLDTTAQVLGLFMKTEEASKVLTVISTQIGTVSDSLQKGVSDLDETQITLTQMTSTGIGTNTSGGGPGAGDILHFFKDVMMAWSFLNGQMKLLPIGYTEAALSAGGILNNPGTAGISAADSQMLLALDPFVAGGAFAALPPDRFTFQESWDYGYSVTIPKQFTVTHDTKETMTHKDITTNTSEWDPGPIFQLLGFGGKSSTTITVGTATGTEVSTSVTLNVNLAAGPNDHFNVNIWYDNLFGTFAFQQVAPAPAARLEGTATPGQAVTLTAGGRTYRTAANAQGKYSFWASAIPVGSATVSVAGHAGSPVMIAK